MDAILLVGGLGTRLLPLTKDLPKPLIPLANTPFAERVIAWIRDAGVDHIILSLHYNAEQFQDYFTSRSLGVELSFAYEETPLGTGGAIKNCEPFLRSEQCFIFNGDIFTSLQLPAMLKNHRRSGACASIAMIQVEDASRFGAIDTDGDGRILSFTEKPPPELARNRMVNAGIYLFEQDVFSHFPAGPNSVERDVFPTMLRKGLHIAGYLEQPYWTDLGTPADYLQAHHDILFHKVQVPITCRESAPGIWRGEQVEIAEDALIRPPVLLGNGVRIESGATVGPAVVLGDGVCVEPNALVEDSVIWEGAIVHADSLIRGLVIGRETHVAGTLVSGHVRTTK